MTINKIMMKLALSIAAAAALNVPAQAAPDGEKLFKTRCSACHWDPATPDEKPRMGPSLKGVVGRKAGEGPFKRYSPAMKAASFTWTAETLGHYLDDPRKTVKGTSMAFPGLKKADERAAVVAYIMRASK